METDEAARLEALRAYRILDTDPEEAFDDLALLASRICGTPIAAITLIDEDRQWFKARVGLAVGETPREIAFCNAAIRQPDLFVVPDALADARFRDNPFVTAEPHIRFYTGAPLVTPEGHALGTLCVVDRKPRILTEDQIEALEALRRQVMAQLELRRNLAELARALEARDRAEATRETLLTELREALDEVRLLGGLVPESSACQLDVTIPARASAIPKVVSGIMQLVKDKGVAAGHEVEVEIALHEALANAVKHGCKGDPEKSVQCCVACDATGELVILVRDPGAGFDLDNVPSPLAAPGIMKESGRGIFLINELMDEVRYEEGGRTLRMRKRGNGSAGRNPSARELGGHPDA
jgi:anti-sigma regulatory factor (Ser/Thr protein kinase)